MTIKIEIFADPSKGDMSDQIARAMHALGYVHEGKMVQAITDPENQPSQWGTVPLSNLTASEADAVVALNAPSAHAEEPAEAPKRTRAKKGAKAAPTEAPQISTNPESRVGPEDDAEIDAQDEADEQAEVEAKRDPEKPLTAEDLKNAAGAYVQKFGMEACQLDGAKLLIDVLGKPPGDESYWKISTIAGLGQDHLRKAIDAWDAAVKSDTRYGAS